MNPGSSNRKDIEELKEIINEIRKRRDERFLLKIISAKIEEKGGVTIRSPQKEYKEALRQFSEILEKVYKGGKRETIRELAKWFMSNHKEFVETLVWDFWDRRELITRGVGYFFHTIFQNIKKDVKNNKNGHKLHILPPLALLSLAAHHDVPTVARLDDGTVKLLGMLLEGISKEDIDFFFGRRSLKKLADLWHMIGRYIGVLPYTLLRDIVKKELKREKIERYGRESGGYISWPEFLLLKLEERLKRIPVNVEKYNIHPDEVKYLKPYLLSYYGDVDKKLRKARGEEFFRYKFGKHHTFIMKILQELERINKRKRKYSYTIPDNFVEHLHAQIIPNACTSWDDYILGILHGPSIPIVLKTKGGKTVGRIFITLAKHPEQEEYYLVLGDYEGRKEGRNQFKKEILPLLREISREYLGTEPKHYSEVPEKFVAPHKNPWVV